MFVCKDIEMEHEETDENMHVMTIALKLGVQYRGAKLKGRRV